MSIDSAWYPRLTCRFKSLLVRNPFRRMEILRVSEKTWFRASESGLPGAAIDKTTAWPPGNNGNLNKHRRETASIFCLFGALYCIYSDCHSCFFKSINLSTIDTSVRSLPGVRSLRSVGSLMNLLQNNVECFLLNPHKDFLRLNGVGHYDSTECQQTNGNTLLQCYY